MLTSSKNPIWRKKNPLKKFLRDFQNGVRLKKNRELENVNFVKRQNHEIL